MNIIDLSNDGGVDMAQFQAYNKLLISAAEGIANHKAGDAVLGYEFYCQYPSYRGTYLSCIEEMHVYVDGEMVPDDKIYFHINGKQCLLSQFKDLYLEYWFILDKAKLLILKDGGLKPGEHEVKVTMRHKIPYTGYFGNYLVLDGSDTKILKLRDEEAE